MTTSGAKMYAMSHVSGSTSSAPTVCAESSMTVVAKNCRNRIVFGSGMNVTTAL